MQLKGVYAQTHVFKVSVKKGFQWVLFVATDSTNPDMVIKQLEVVAESDYYLVITFTRIR